MPKKHMSLMINVAVAATTAYLVVTKTAKSSADEVMWYNPTTWF